MAAPNTPPGQGLDALREAMKPPPPPPGFRSERNSTPGMEELARAMYASDQGDKQAAEQAAKGAQDKRAKDAAALKAQRAANDGEEPDETPESDEAETPDEGQVQEPGETPVEETDDEDPLIPVTVQGRELEVPFSELRKGYMLQADYTQKSQRLAQDRQQMEAERATTSVAVEQQVARLSNFADALAQHLQAYQPDPQQDALLQQQDPGLWAAQREHRRQQEQALAIARQVQQQHAAQQLQRRIPQERAALQAREELPEFAEDFEKTYHAVGQWATSPEGGILRPDEWQEVVDWRLVRILRLAQIGQQALAGNQRAKANQKRLQQDVRRLPKVRSGATQPSKDAKREALDNAIARLKQPGGQSNDAIAAAFLAKRRAGGA